MPAFLTETLADEAALAVASKNYDFSVPARARAAIFHWNITAVGGTTPIADLKLQYKNPGTSEFEDLSGAAFGQKTGADYQALAVSPSGVADVTGDHRVVNAELPSALRAVFTGDRTTANETYTFTIKVEWLE